MTLLDILRQQSKLLAAIAALVVVLVDRLAIMRAANLLDIFLQALVREEAARLVGRRGRTRQRARTFRNVRKELGSLERIAFLLQVLVVQRSLAGLLRLLAKLAGSHLSLSALQASSLGSSAQRTIPLPQIRHVLGGRQQGCAIGLASL